MFQVGFLAKSFTQGTRLISLRIFLDVLTLYADLKIEGIITIQNSDLYIAAPEF